MLKDADKYLEVMKVRREISRDGGTLRSRCSRSERAGMLQLKLLNGAFLGSDESQGVDVGPGVQVSLV